MTETTGSHPGTQSGHFRRALGLVDATAIVVGSMIGSGIFIVSAETARQVGSPGWLLACWLLAGSITVAGAVCYGELTAMFPAAGGQYVFLREAYGKLFGFLYGWTLFAVIQSGTIAAVAVAFAKFLGVFCSVVSDQNLVVAAGSWHLSVLQLVAVAVIALLTYINCRGIREAKLVQNTFTFAKVGALVALVALAAFLPGRFFGLKPNLEHFWAATSSDGSLLVGWTFLGVIALATVGPLFASDAWNNITFAGEEVKEARFVLAKSLALGTIIVTVIYLLTNVVYLLLLPLDGSVEGADVLLRGIKYATEDRVGTAAAEVLFGGVGVYLMAGAIMISTFGCLNGLILAGPRAYYAMAKDRLFFARAAHLSPTTNVPVFGLVLQGVWASVLATSGTYSNLLEYVVFAALAFYVLTAAAVFVLRVRLPDHDRPVKVPLYPVLPALYILLCLGIIAGELALSPVYSGAGLLIILSGLPAYLFWRRR